MSAIGREYTDVMYDKCFTSVHNFFPQKNQNLRVDVMREWKRKMGVGSPIYLFPFWLLFFVPCRFDPTHSTQKNMLIDFLFCYVCCWPFSEWHDCVGGGVDGEKYSKTAARYKWEKEEVIEQSAWKPRLLCCYMYYKHPTLFVTYIGKKKHSLTRTLPCKMRIGSACYPSHNVCWPRIRNSTIPVDLSGVIFVIPPATTA